MTQPQKIKTILFIVTYKAKFTDESIDVTVRIVFEDINGEMKISSEFYDSPNLRQ